MNTILGIEIPAELASLESDALAALRVALRSAAQAALAAGDIDPEKLAEIKNAKAKADEIGSTLSEREAAEAELAAEVAEVAASLADEPEAEAEAEVEPEAEADEPEVEAEVEAEPVAVTAAWQPTAAGVAATAPKDAPPAPAAAKSGSYADAGFVATANIDGHETGEAFDGLKDLGSALVERFSRISGGSNDRVAVAKTFATWKPEQLLTESVEDNYAKFGGSDPLASSAVNALTAALCAPTEPLYGLATMSSTARPVKASLGAYKPARGRVSVYPTPKLADITDGRGIWTATNDETALDVKEACATIACATPEVYSIYGVYRCLTVKNMLAMTFPELVEAYLNRLGALTARLAEEALLDAMVGSVNTVAMTVDATADNNFDASINLLTTVLNAVAIYREEERYGDQQFDAWIPRWVIPALQIGLVRQRRTAGVLSDRLPSAAEITAVFRTAGVDVTWTMDSAATWADVDPAVDAAALPGLPTTVDIIMSPKGNFRALDRGDLTIGVASGNIYRDNASNTKNEFTMFQESFEGLMDFGATSYALTVSSLSFNGAQTADVTAIAAPV